MTAPDDGGAARRARAEAWLAIDPDPETRAELAALLAAGDDDGLAERFGPPLTFGTAGLRAPLGAGPSRLNRVVVRQAAAGLARWLAPGSTVVIGYDARHRSDAFAADTAAVLAAAGHRALVFPGVVPTPLLAFAVLHLGADAGVMCTASHNPATDNGYKVYLGDGAQLLAPADRAIAAAIAGTDPATIALASPDDPAIGVVGPEVEDAYLRRVVALAGPGPVDVSAVYTPLHGVGGALFRRALDAAGIRGVHALASQAEPDGTFPTAPFPNPEEPGVLDLAIADAARRGAGLVVAHDPDADRLGAAVRAAGGWRVLTGDEIGAVLAEHLLSAGEGPDRLVATSFVSSRLLARLAEHHGVQYAETLTGFKWIVRPALEHPELRWVFGYEEALGYSVDDGVRDKDGLAAAVVLLRLVARLAAEGRTVLDLLDDLARRHGVHGSRSWSRRFDGRGGAERMAAVLTAFRASPPAALGGRAVRATTDLRAGGDGLPPTDAVILDLEGGARVIVRPSGTEPKVKCYAQVVVPVADGGDVAQARQRAAVVLRVLAADLDGALVAPPR